tara:strand:+ start:958 stop:1413 length:456 start_codon:yes stop_codon:yes gene_type:complete
MTEDYAIELAFNLRQFAAFVETQHENLPDRVTVAPYSWVWGWNVEDVPAVMGNAAHAGARSKDCSGVEKEYNSSTMNLDLVFGDLNRRGHPGGDFKYTIHCERDQVCTKRVVGTKMVMKSVPPEGEWTDVEEEEEIVEWDCHPLLEGTTNA